MLDDCGATIDAVYYNKLRSDDGSIVHSGDSKDGVIKGYNEVITVDLSKLNYAVAYLVVLVNSYNGASFKKVETATCSILQGGAKICDDVYLGASGDSNAVLCGILFRQNPLWSYVNIMAQGTGKNFQECRKLILKSLPKAGFDAVLLKESKNWTTGNQRTFNMAKDGVVNIPEAMKVFRVALGWDTELDIDCSLVMMDKWGNAIDTVYFGNLKSQCGAVVHSGDNTTGRGRGDDETITISLERVNKEV